MQQRPDQPMTVCGDRIRTCAEVGGRVTRLAGAFRDLGVQVGDRVAILSLNSDRYHEYFFATWWMGGAVNPLNTRWSAAEIAFALDDSDTRVLVVDDTFLPLLDEVRVLFPQLAVVIHAGELPTPAGALDYENLIASSEPKPDLRLGGDHLAGIFYTGGTSGHPKGVMLTHANLVTSSLGAVASNRTPGTDGLALITAPMFHLASLANWIGRNTVGATLVIQPSFEPATALRLIEQHKVTSMLLVPTMIQMLIRHPDRTNRDLSSILAVQYGASPISETLLRQAQQAFPQAAFMQGYGMTEAGPGLTSLSAEDHVDATRLKSAGRPMGHVEIQVVDENGNELPRGEVGEIIARGGNIMCGYWNRPEENTIGIARRLAVHRRRRLHGRSRVSLRRGSAQGHDHLGWRERLFDGGRKRAGHTSGRDQLRCDRRTRRSVRRASPRGPGRASRGVSDVRRSPRTLEDADCRLQVSAKYHHRRANARVPGWQDTQERTPQAVLRLGNQHHHLTTPPTSRAP